jgi:serine/threonine protein kinase
VQRRYALYTLCKDAVGFDRNAGWNRGATATTAQARGSAANIASCDCSGAAGWAPSDGSLYMVQELLHGEDLRARLRAAGKLAPREALELLVPVVGALAAAHEDGVVHREQSRSDGRRVSRMRQLGAAQR